MAGLDGAEMRPVPCRTVESMVPSSQPFILLSSRPTSRSGGGGASSARTHATLKADFEPPFVTGEVVPLRGACRRPRRGEHTRPCRRQGDPSLLLVARVP